MTDRRVSEEWLEQATEIPDVGAASYADLLRSVRGDPDVPGFRPLPNAAVDPRTGTRVVFCDARAGRPHDHDLPEPRPDPPDCIVCEGKTTSVIDRAPLSGGDETFINKNLFPILFPPDDGALEEGTDDPGPAGERAGGMHFLQWSSTRHDRDLHDLPTEDVAVLLARLARLEEVCLHDSSDVMPVTRDRPGDRHHGHFCVIKNVGRMVGGSLVHGHQQMVHGSIAPRRVAEDARFLADRGEPFASHLLSRTPPDLVVKDYPGGARLVVPWFMRRPLDTVLVLDGSEPRENLHELSHPETLALAQGVKDMVRATVALMPGLGREIAYNMVFHTGPVGALYVEMLPYTQERGGYESAGIVICQGEPVSTARTIRRALGSTRGSRPNALNRS